MRARTVAVGLVGMLGGAAAAQPLSPSLEPATPPGAATVKVGFDWAPRCRVPAHRIIDKPAIDRRHIVETTFDLVITRDGDNLLVAIDDAKLVSVDGQPPDGVPPARAAAAFVEGTLWPSITVTPGGGFIALRDVDGAIDATLARAPIPPGSTQRDRMRATIAAPAWREMLAQQIEGDWRDWAGTWANVRISPRKPLERSLSLENRAEGYKVVVHTRLSHRGSPGAPPGLVLLESLETVDAADAMKMMVAASAFVAKERGPSSYTVARAAWQRRVTAAVEPATGRTHRVRSVLTIMLDGLEHVTTTDTAFAWARASGCGRP